MTIFLFFPDFHVFWNVTSFSKREAWLMLVTPALLGSDSAGAHSHSLLFAGFPTKVKVEVTLRLEVYRQTFHLGVKPLETHDQRPSSTEPLWSQSLCNILSDEKMGLSLMNMLGFSSSVRIAHIARYWIFFLLHYIQVLCQYRFCKALHAYLTYLMLQRQLSHVNGRKLHHRQV
jgi:hypothetical protein